MKLDTNIDDVRMEIDQEKINALIANVNIDSIGK